LIASLAALSTPVIAVALPAALSHSTTAQAFSGPGCAGHSGNVVQCDGSCHSFVGRTAIQLPGWNDPNGSAGFSIFNYFSGSGCSGAKGTYNGPGGPICLKVTATSFSCNVAVDA